MPQWGAFVGLTAILVTLLLVVTRLTQQLVGTELYRPDKREPAAPGGQSAVADAEVSSAVVESSSDEFSGEVDPSADAPSAVDNSGTDTRHRQSPDATWNQIDSLSPGAILANVALTQGLIGVAVLVGAWAFDVPAWALGIPVEQASAWPMTVLAGLGLGLVLWLASESASTLADAAGVTHGEQLRAVLAPTTASGWIVLLVVTLPTVAIGEELLFRAAAIGVPAEGFGTSPWALALVSSIAFAFCHGIQGRAGIVVTGVLGFVLAGAFVLTESLLLVVVAHYVLNATEFLVHEGLGVDPLAAWS